MVLGLQVGQGIGRGWVAQPQASVDQILLRVVIQIGIRQRIVEHTLQDVVVGSLAAVEAFELPLDGIKQAAHIPVVLTQCR